MTNISNARIAILATDGFEKSELFEPRKQLVDAGADITIVSLESGSIKSWDETDWGESIDVDITLDDASEDDFDALVLPGGQINPDLLRVEKNAVDFVKAFFDAGKPIAAICHAPWLLIEADLVQGHKVTGYKSIKTDLINAGGLYEDSEVVVDNGLITSRNPDDLDAFSAKIIEEVKEGIHDRTQEAA
jgi:protease I